ncbi:MAG: hypothetical protein HKN56_10990 [Gammaproteobacteria bacterium]|nr:hypothetical protein [Gammaproteobacteria bacterium]
MNSAIRLCAVVVSLFSLLIIAPVYGQGTGGLDAAQLGMLEQMSPEEREQVLEALLGSSAGNDAALEFPELISRDGDDEEEPDEYELFDADGNPLLDDYGRQIVIDREQLEDLEQETPSDWLARDRPFYQQDILLKPFGYGLFEGVPTTFAPATDIPVPNEYKLGPGDTIDVQLFGKENRQYSLVVNREGSINFPNIGPVTVVGRSFQDVKQDLLDRVAEQLIGTSASVTMGALRSINVVVVGDAQQPGSYTVSGLSTITNALFVSGGVSDVGSLRNITVKRSGRVVSRLDLYDLLLRGDARNDIRLESGDVIFISPIGDTVSVGGFVKRPAIYELRGETSVAEMLAMAGGLRADAFPQGARIERINESRDRGYINIDLNDGASLQQEIRAGDTLLVPPVLMGARNGVRLLGHVRRPGAFEWTPNMRLTDLIGDLDDLLAQADLEYILIRRETVPEKRISVVSANLLQALANPASDENVRLQYRDEVYVFSLYDAALEEEEGGSEAEQFAALLLPTAEAEDDDEDEESEEIDYSSRSSVVTMLLEELQQQAGANAPYERVTVSGEVRNPGEYPYESGMRLSDLLRAGGGLTESAFEGEAELTRYSIVGRRARTSELFNINVADVLAGDLEQDMLIAPSDFLTVRRMQDWSNEITVTLEGEVRYPGTYTVRNDETLLSVIERAGGLTDQAFPEGSVFLREDLRDREEQQILSLRERLRSDIAAISLQAAGSTQDVSVVEAQSAGTALLSALNSVDPTGRLVIDLPGLLKGNAETDDVLLEDGDELLIPKQTQAVTVIGEVQFSTSHLFVPGLKRNGYISRSGGLTPNAAKKGIYIVRANGAVIASGRWGSGSARVEPGDTIVVPLDTQKGFRLQSWASITSIIYNAAIAVAAINGISD